MSGYFTEVRAVSLMDCMIYGALESLTVVDPPIFIRQESKSSNAGIQAMFLSGKGRLKDRKLMFYKAAALPGIVCAGHGSFLWSKHVPRSCMLLWCHQIFGTSPGA